MRGGLQVAGAVADTKPLGAVAAGSAVSCLRYREERRY